MPTKEEHAALIGFKDKGRRVVSLTKHSTMDSLIYGRDLDQSGEDPHRDHMRSMLEGGYAGEPSGHRDAKMANRKLRAVLNVKSAMQQHIDEKTPHEEFMTKFADHAGARTVQARFKPLRRPGLAHTQSMPDILGNPSVARTPRGIRVKEVDAAGGKTDPELQRTQGRACVIATKWTRSTLRLGDVEHPGALLEEIPDERFDGHAGQARKQIKPAKVGSSLKCISVVDKLLYGRDLSGAQTDPAVEYAQKFTGYAGSSWKIPKKMSFSDQSETNMEGQDDMRSTQEELQAKPEATLIPTGEIYQDPAWEPAKEVAELTPGPELVVESPMPVNSVSFQTDPEMGGKEAPQADEMSASPKAESCDAPVESDLVDAKVVALVPRPSPPATPTRTSPFAIAQRSPSGSSNGSRTPSVSGQRPRWK